MARIRAFTDKSHQQGAFCTVVNALMMPVPIVPTGGGGAANGLIQVLISVSTCAGAQSAAGFDCINATKPATCGDAIDVPL